MTDKSEAQRLADALEHEFTRGRISNQSGREAAALLRRWPDDAERIAALEAALSFVERWANHHAAKPHMTAGQALSVIQHHPAIKEITKSYEDGKVPDTPDPWAALEQARVALEELLHHNGAGSQERGQAALNAIEEVRRAN